MEDPALRQEMNDLRDAISRLLIDERAHTPRPAAELLERVIGVLDYLFTRVDLIDQRVHKLENRPPSDSGR